jgi:hypothetical protein
MVCECVTWMAAWLYTCCACALCGLLGSSCTGASMMPGRPLPSSRDVTATGPTACTKTAPHPVCLSSCKGGCQC